ncbi:hypothetical protein CDAR_244121 [Caerostris darwini]|uniref:Uncharacterized protein n=1 Tax=Caerostris darwini TaxID=1538125 RepID=A0AAV4RGV2_9ARAC|nr:hypothetical protein CDAR_244121 [Caerostris darwini]
MVVTIRNPILASELPVHENFSLVNGSGPSVLCPVPHFGIQTPVLLQRCPTHTNTQEQERNPQHAGSHQGHTQGHCWLHSKQNASYRMRRSEFVLI